MNQISMINGDSLIELKHIDDESIDLIITDPPYNLNKDYGNNKDCLEFSNYLEFSKEWITECKRILKKTGTIYIFMGFRYISYIYNILSQELNMNFVNWISWHYTQGIGKTKGFSPRHDDILMFSKTPKYNFYLDNIRIPQKYYRSINNMRGANPGDVWEFSHVHYCNENRQNHPTQKPEGLIERMVLASSKEGDNVLDPFSGSGTTLRVCQQTNRNCIGIEINPEYIDMTHERLDKKFNGFDSIDPRMERIPLDLRDNNIRKEYIENHKKWFLKNHEQSIEKFMKQVELIYPQNKKQIKGQIYLFDNAKSFAN